MERDRLHGRSLGLSDGQVDGQGGILARISNAMVAIHKEQFGRGPTKASTHFAGPDTIVSTLRDTFTPAERNLVAMGEHGRLRDIRMFFQYSQSDKFVGVVEEITGRRVESFISGIDAESDVAVEIFLLAPASGADGDHAGL